MVGLAVGVDHRQADLTSVFPLIGQQGALRKAVADGALLQGGPLVPLTAQQGKAGLQGLVLPAPGIGAPVEGSQPSIPASSP